MGYRCESNLEQRTELLFLLSHTQKKQKHFISTYFLKFKLKCLSFSLNKTSQNELEKIAFNIYNKNDNVFKQKCNIS